MDKTRYTSLPQIPEGWPLAVKAPARLEDWLLFKLEDHLPREEPWRASSDSRDGGYDLRGCWCFWARGVLEEIPWPTELWNTGERRQATPPPPPSKLVWKTGTAFLGVQENRGKWREKFQKNTNGGFSYWCRDLRKSMASRESCRPPPVWAVRGAAEPDNALCQRTCDRKQNFCAGFSCSHLRHLASGLTFCDPQG